MTNSPGWVQNRRRYWATGGQAARRPKLRVERRPFLAPEDVIFGVVFTGPYILSVKHVLFIAEIFPFISLVSYALSIYFPVVPSSCASSTAPFPFKTL